MICKHFNISWSELQRTVSLPEYYCLLAESLDAEELTTYHWWINSQQDPKKFKWSSPDHAGTKATRSGSMADVFNFAKTMATKKGASMVRGNAKEFASATGREVIYIDKHKNYFDAKGNAIQFTPKSKRGRNAVVLRKKDG